MNNPKTALILRLLLAGVFIISAVAKLMGIGPFEIAVVTQGLAADRAAAALPARLLITLELFLGLVLLFPFYLKRWVLPATAGLLGAFILLQGWQLTFGEAAQDCGCFGELLPMSSGQSLIKNVVLLAISVWLYRISPTDRRHLIIPLLIALVSITAVFIAAPIGNSTENGFQKYSDFQNSGPVDLTNGDKLLAIFNADCEHCQETAIELDFLSAGERNLPPIYVLMFAENEAAIATFFEITGSSFPYHKISDEEFFRLIGNAPPRIYWLQNGAVKAYWDEDFANNIESTFIDSSIIDN